MAAILRIGSALVGAAFLCCSVGTAAARSERPLAGELTLDVDLADPGQRIFRVHEHIPASAGSLTLYYPKWIPGEHAPSGTISAVTGLIITTDGGQRVDWRRDLEDMFTLHLTVPAGTKTLQLEFQLLSPSVGGGFGQSVSVTDRTGWKGTD